MQAALNLLDHSNLLAMGVLAAILCFVGSRVATAEPASRPWGLRIAVLAFIVYVIYRTAAVRPSDADELAAIAFRALFVAGIALGASWLALAVVVFAHRRLVTPSLGALNRSVVDNRQRAQERQRATDEARHQRESHEAYERAAPERERERRQQELRARVQAQEQHRREIARANCLALYGRYGAHIKKRFDRAMLDEFFQTYMSDARPAEFVEERASQLQTLLRQHYEAVRPPPKFRNLREITAHFQQQLREIADLPIEDRTRRTLLAATTRQQAEAFDNFLRGEDPS